MLVYTRNMKNEIIVFTDGASSGNPGPGGWGAVIVNPALSEVVELGGGQPKTTNNIMELQAAIASLSFLVSTTDEIVIYTDSKYVMEGITKWVFGWMQNGWKTKGGDPVKNQEEWKTLYQLATERAGRSGLRWEYVPGHAGIPGNERADAIAVSFYTGEPAKLFRGNLAEYMDPSIANTEGLEEARERKAQPNGKAFCYVSLIDGKVKKYDTWVECEAEVKNTQGAKYRKAVSPEHLEEILTGWGVSLE
jgi:ribonuclease HI